MIKLSYKEYRDLLILACCFLVSGLIQYLPALTEDTFRGKNIRQIVFIIFEITFLSNFLYILLDKKIKRRYWAITALLFSIPVLLTIKNNKIIDYKDGLIFNIYYAVFSFLAANLIFTFLIFTKHLFVDTTKTKKSIFEMLMGLLIYYILKISCHTSLAYLKFEDVYQLNQGILFIHILDSIAILSHSIGLILLTMLLYKAIVNREVEARKT